MPTRRNFLLAGLSLSAAAALPAELARAQSVTGFNTTSNGSDSAAKINARPYLEIGNFPDDRNRVFMFFMYTCPFCAQYASSFEAWGNTIPKPMLFVPVPLMIDDPVALSAAASYYVLRQLAPQRISEFEGFAYETGQHNPTPEAFPAILYRMGLERSTVLAALNSPDTGERLKRAAALGRRYRVDATPDFGVAGKYTTNANFTGGNYDTLVQLLNGLISGVITS
jgi:thiol:disulfide interchange protein DsbA